MPYRLAIAQEGGYRDSNPGPPEPQSGALTNCAIPTMKKNRRPSDLSSVPEGIRTPDPRLRRPLLYPAELRTHCGISPYGRTVSCKNNGATGAASDCRRACPAKNTGSVCTVKAGDGNRTHVSSLEGWCSTIELHLHTNSIGVTGFEPATSWSQTRRSSQAEPHPGCLTSVPRL